MPSLTGLSSVFNYSIDVLTFPYTVFKASDYASTSNPTYCSLSYQITNQDLVTFKIKGHVNHINCEWLFLLRYQQSIIALERFKPESLEFTFSMFAFGPLSVKTCHVGKNQVFLYIFGDFEKIIPLYFTVVDYASLDPFKHHPEDEKLKEQPTLFNSLLGKIEDESDDEK